MNEEKNIENTEINQIGIRFNPQLNLIEIGIISPDKTINLKLNLQAVIELNKGFYGVIEEATEFLNLSKMDKEANQEEKEAEERKEEKKLEEIEVLEEVTKEIKE